MSNKFDRFTKKARQVLTYAQEEAQLMNHGYIGTEHLLLGLVREQTGIPAKILHDLGVDLQKTRENYHMLDDEFQLPVLTAQYLTDSTVPATLRPGLGALGRRSPKPARRMG